MLSCEKYIFGGFYLLYSMQTFLGFASTYSTFYGHQQFSLYEEDDHGTMVFKRIHPVNYFHQRYVFYYTGALFENIDIPYLIAIVINALIRMKYRLLQTSAHKKAERIPHFGTYYIVHIYDQHYGLLDVYEDILNTKLQSEDLPLKESIVSFVTKSDIASNQAVTDGILEVEYRFLNINGMNRCFLHFFCLLCFFFD